MIDLEWMAWTVPTAIFFATIAAILIAMTGLELVRPTVERKGFMPMTTTRGDRLFLALLAAAFIHAGYVYASDSEQLWAPLAASVVAGLLIMRFG